MRAWYGVRIFSDPLTPEQAAPPEPELKLLLDAEYQASRRDPYRYLGSQIHLISERLVA